MGESASNAANEQYESLLTIREVSDITGLAVGSLYHLVSQHRIPVVRLSKRCIRFRYSDLMRWIQVLTHEPEDGTAGAKKGQTR